MSTSGQPKHDVVYREAILEDYEGVLNINQNIYGGNDYMHTMFPVFVADNRRFLAVAEINGEVVAFQMNLIVDDGTRMVTQAARVKDGYLGNHLVTNITVWAYSKLLEKYPDLVLNCWTTANREETELFLKKVSHSRLLCERHRFSVDVTTSALRNAVKSPSFQREYSLNNGDCAQVMTPDSAAHNLYKNIANMKSLNPDGFWIINSEVFGMNWSNYHYMLKDCTTVMTFTKPDTYKRMLSDSTKKVSGPVKKVSFSDKIVSKSFNQVSDPVNKVSDHFNKVSDPVRKVSDPAKKVSDHVKKVSDPVKKVSDSVKEMPELPNPDIKRGYVIAVSFLTTIESPGGLRVRGDAYIDKEVGNPLEVLKSHILKHFITLSQRASGKRISYSLIVPDWVDIPGMKDYLKNDFGLKRESTIESPCLCMQMDMSKYAASKM